MKDPILEILLDNLNEVIRGDMFDPQDVILDIIWWELSKDHSFHYDATSQSTEYSGLVREYMIKRTPRILSSLDYCTTKLYRLDAYSVAEQYESECWLASNDTRTDDDPQDYG
jgi:hypothetical protein